MPSARKGKNTAGNIDFNTLEVRALMVEVNQHKAHRPNGIPPFALRECEEILDKQPLMLFKIFLKNDNATIEWKRASVAPVGKKVVKK